MSSPMVWLVRIQVKSELGEDYSVDSERTKTLVSVLRRVVEGLEDN